MSGMKLRNRFSRSLVGGLLLAILVSGATSDSAIAQQVNIGVNHHDVGFSYWESIGTNFGFFFPGHLNSHGHGIVGLMPNGQFTPDGSINFQQGGGVFPVFGGFDPNAGLATGWSVRGPHGGFHFGLSASQGSSTTLGGDSMSLTVPNGGSGFIQSGTFRPFVTGIVPVLGSGPTYLPPLTAGSRPYVTSAKPSEPRSGTDKALKTGSSAERGASSLAALRAQAEEEDSAAEATRTSDIERLVNRAKTAKREGKETLAGNYLRAALKKATPQEIEQIEATWRAE